MCILKLSCVAASHRYHSCSCHVSPRIGVYFAVSPCIVVYRIVSVFICSIDPNRRGRRQLALRKKSGKSTRIRVGRKNQVLTRIVGYQERPVLTVLTSIVHVSSGRRVPSRIGTCRGCIEKVKSGVLRIGHVFMVFTRVSNGPNPACAESACIVMYRACLERVQIGVQVFTGIVKYR